MSQTARRFNRSGGRPDVIRVLLVDDVENVRQTLRAILATYPNFEVVGEACNGEEALEAVQVLKPSVVVMDINMPRLDGIKATMLIKRVYPHVVVVGLSVYANDDTRQAMTAAGELFCGRRISRKVSWRTGGRWSSVAAAIRASMATDSTGKRPTADSPESIRQSVPSRTALATSVWCMQKAGCRTSFGSRLALPKVTTRTASRSIRGAI